MLNGKIEGCRYLLVWSSLARCDAQGIEVSKTYCLLFDYENSMCLLEKAPYVLE